MHAVGLGACQDHHIAMEYFLKAASLGNPMGMSNIGEQFFYGRWVTVNLHYALAWYLKSGKKPDRMLELSRKGIFLTEVDQSKFFLQCSQ
jgi:TPR repeat protein